MSLGVCVLCIVLTNDCVGHLSSSVFLWLCVRVCSG